MDSIHQGYIIKQNCRRGSFNLLFPQTSPKHKNPTLARTLAFRAAKGDAMRNLLEQIQSTQITSDTKIKDMMAENDTIRIQINSSLRGARVVNKKQMPDGSVEVEMEVELTEDFINNLYSE